MQINSDVERERNPFKIFVLVGLEISMDNAIGMEVLERQDCFANIHSALELINARISMAVSTALY